MRTHARGKRQRNSSLPSIARTHARGTKDHIPKSSNCFPGFWPSREVLKGKEGGFINLVVMGRTLFCLARFVAHFVALVADVRAYPPKKNPHPHTRARKYSPFRAFRRDFERAHAHRHNTSRTVNGLIKKDKEVGQMDSERSEDGRPRLALK